MSPTKTDLFICSPEPNIRQNIEGASVSICKEAEKRGWYASGRWSKTGIRIRLQNHDKRALADMVQALVRCAEKDCWTLTIIEKSSPLEAEQADQAGPGQIQWGALIHEKLTRKLLNRLPEGAFVVSNCFAGSESIFAERVPPMRYRAPFWHKAKHARAVGRVCHILWSEEDFDRYRYRGA